MPNKNRQGDTVTYLAGQIVEVGSSPEHPGHDEYQGYITLHFQGGDRIKHRLLAAGRLRRIVQCQLRKKAGYCEEIRQRSEQEIDEDNQSAVSNARARHRRLALHRTNAAIEAFNRNNTRAGRAMRSRWAEHRTPRTVPTVPRHTGAPATQAFNDLMDHLDARHEERSRHAR